VASPGERDTIIDLHDNAPKRNATSADWLRVAGMTKRYGSVAALGEVDFSVHRQEILGLIGPNGAGKTTLFECMAGVLPPNSGGLFIDGRPLPGRNRRQILFYLPDAIAPWPSQSVRWALDFTVGFLGGRANLVDDLIDGLTLSPLLMSRVGTLSKGQRKRVLLAIGLLTSQPVLLADEPFEGLDLRQSREVSAILRAHARAGRTLFLSIHQIADAARICDRFILLSGGRVCGEGSLDELTATARSRGSSASSLEEVFLALT
jgi:ABC-2 type transport system ATP-binding protein